MLQFVLKIVYISLVSQFNWFMLRVFNVKVKNLAFETSKIITNARFSMKN